MFSPRFRTNCCSWVSSPVGPRLDATSLLSESVNCQDIINVLQGLLISSLPQRLIVGSISRYLVLVQGCSEFMATIPYFSMGYCSWSPYLLTLILSYILLVVLAPLSWQCSLTLKGRYQCLVYSWASTFVLKIMCSHKVLHYSCLLQGGFKCL